MFKETKEGQTHSYNDGCGEPAHNSMPQNIKQFIEEKVKGLQNLAVEDIGFEDCSAQTQKDFENYLAKSLSATVLETLRVVGEILDDTTVADGFVGFTDEEWNGVKKFIPIFSKTHLSSLSSLASEVNEKLK